MCVLPPSIARCLGAKRVCKRSFEWLSQHEVISYVLTDRDAVAACVGLADDHRILVPPACGAALGLLYGQGLSQLQATGKLPGKMSNVLAIVCGGSGVNLDTVQRWRKDYQL